MSNVRGRAATKVRHNNSIRMMEFEIRITKYICTDARLINYNATIITAMFSG
jgi:hypothetical protein